MSGHVANWSQESGTIFTGAVAAVGTLLDCKRYTELCFDVSASATETIQLFISQDGGTTWSTNALGFASITTPGTIIATAPAATAASYYVRFPPCTAIKFVKSGAADTVTVKATLRWS